MRLKLPIPLYNLMKATSFWRDNYLILREFKNFRKIAILAIIFSLLAAIFEGFTIGLISVFLRSFTNPDTPPLQTGISWFDIWFLGTNASFVGRLYRIGTLVFLTVWLRSSFVYLGNLYIKLSELHLGDGLRKSLFKQFLKLSLSYFAKKRSAELFYSINNEVYQIKIACNVAAAFIAKGFTLIVYVTAMFWLSWQLTVISVLLFSLLTASLSNLVKWVREVSFEISKAGSNFSSVAMEFISGIRTVQAFATEDFERRKFYQACEQVESANTKAAAASSVVQPLTEGVSATILLLIVVVAVTISGENGRLQIASLLTFLFVLLRLGPLVSQINGAWSRLNSFQGSLDNIKSILRTDDKTYLENGRIDFDGLKQAIDFVAVDFGYDAENLVLHNITLTINQGEMTALVGASGAGKTTLVDLIPRFYEPVKGKLLIDGVDLRDLNIKSLRRKLAIVSQDTFIFNTSVKNNIAYGSEDADEAAIIEAAQLANALEFILDMPNGFETQLGDRGVRLSGGQRQRIAIARALLRNPEILILDEATSALDSLSERLIQESLEKLAVGRTVIAIAHRLSTIIRADKVVVLEQGCIVEQGKYQELLEQRGKLWMYHQMQYESGQVS
ncbi:heterocyst formation ABC transporter subunit HepA [Chlorogloea sp. CCALA 695]|uniref:heterocyst formation ABC transporter subunit HepA n=1 Tax=Chlorogloea sp. CCALA 695 TaxID=2107693 RepID=UPI000D06F37B|nr:heterocyst formation ABC transporter subunit HepA [Chlorogloea sp. CCALA 695]PSB31257.1 ABC transporter ATP-binding protein [Chlorogloea sp. CCALA 695]